MDLRKGLELDERYYLGVDGGGSKTLAVVVDARGVERGRGQAGSANYEAVGLDAAVNNIFSASAQAMSFLDSAVPLEKAWLGLAGVDRPADFAALLPRLNTMAREVKLTNDAELLLSALPATVGVTIISGTGSIALGRNEQGSIVRAGGWGHILGDEGSGYDVGRQALQAAVRAADGRGAQTALLELILRFWEVSNPDDLIGQTYVENYKAKIAKLSNLVFQAARVGDSVAQRIAEQAVEELALVACTVSKKLGFRSEEPVAFALGGGLLLYEKGLREQVVGRIRERQTVAGIYEVEQPALSAARSLVECVTHV